MKKLTPIKDNQLYYCVVCEQMDIMNNTGKNNSH